MFIKDDKERLNQCVTGLHQNVNVTDSKSSGRLPGLRDPTSLILICFIWDRVFKNGPSKICGRQPLRNFTWSILEYFVSYNCNNVSFRSK